MEELWDEARLYGLVRLSTMTDGRYYCTITFSTITHIELVAKSLFDCKTPQDALYGAITQAINIVTSIAEPLAKLKELSYVKPTST